MTGTTSGSATADAQVGMFSGDCVRRVVWHRESPRIASWDRSNRAKKLSATRTGEPPPPESSCLAVDQGLREFAHDVDERHRRKCLGGEGYEL